MIKQNLTKENFWSKLEQKFPNATQYFYKWIDAYKIENNWDQLFNGRIIYNYTDTPQKITNSPKFHNLPLAFQKGIWLEFIDDFYLNNSADPFWDIFKNTYSDFRMRIPFDMNFIEMELIKTAKN